MKSILVHLTVRNENPYDVSSKLVTVFNYNNLLFYYFFLPSTSSNLGVGWNPES